MVTLKFKTNIKCGACIDKVKPILNELVGETNWNVDLSTADRILTLATDKTDMLQIKKSLEQVGYKADAVS